MRLAYFIFLVHFSGLVSALTERNNDYNTNFLDEITLDDEKVPVIRNADDDDGPFKELLSELQNDIGEISESRKRNTGSTSGVQPKVAATITQSSNLTNSNTSPNATQQPISVSTVAKTNLQTATPKPNLNKIKTPKKIEKAKQQKPVVNKEKMAGRAKSTNPQNHQKNRKKINYPKPGKKVQKQRNGIFTQLSCSKTKSAPTCVQIYRECIRERKVEVDRCNRLNSNQKKKVHRRKQLLPKTNASKGKVKQLQKTSKTPPQNPSRNVSNKHPNKSGNLSKLGNNQTGQNVSNNSSQATSANLKVQENQIRKVESRKNNAKHKNPKLQKKMVVGEIRGLLSYLKRMKEHLSRLSGNNAVKAGENKNGH